MPRTLRTRRLLPSLLLATALSGPGRAALSTFDADAEGWRTCNVDFTGAATTVGDFAPAAYAAGGGDPGGAILLLDDDPGWGFFAAPDAFLGDRSAAYGSSLTFDARTDRGDPGAAYPAAVLRSGTRFLYSLSSPPTAAWTPVAIPLVAASWSLSPTARVAADEATLREVLAGLDGLYVEADWATGLGETAGLDNVALNPVPEPSALAILPLAVGAMRRRRR